MQLVDAQEEVIGEFIALVEADQPSTTTLAVSRPIAPPEQVDVNVLVVQSQLASLVNHEDGLVQILTIMPRPTVHVYKQDIMNDFALVIDHSKYASVVNNIVTWELHVTNCHDSPVELMNPDGTSHSDLGPDDIASEVSCGGFTVINLDNSYEVGAGETCVWEFRMDCNSQVLTYRVLYKYTL